MDAHQRQQFDVLLALAADRCAERCEQRCGGAEAALARLAADPQGEGVWLDDFVRAVFADALLEGPDGATWVLAALARRPLPPLALDGARTVGDAAGRLAHAAFAALLRDRVHEELARRAATGAHLLAAHG